LYCAGRAAPVAPSVIAKSDGENSLSGVGMLQ
jgi:hypothetical protein